MHFFWFAGVSSQMRQNQLASRNRFAFSYHVWSCSEQGLWRKRVTKRLKLHRAGSVPELALELVEWMEVAAWLAVAHALAVPHNVADFLMEVAHPAALVMLLHGQQVGTATLDLRAAPTMMTPCTPSQLWMARPP